MSHLIQEYAKSCGVKIGKPIVGSKFMPIPHEKYITINTSTVQAKSYSHWSEVILLIKEKLSELGIQIIQIKSEQGKEIEGCERYITGNYKQLFGVVKCSMLHVGTDSVFQHYAGNEGIPIITIYSNANPENIRPWFVGKSSEIVAPWKAKPSYSHQENEKVIDLIKPEEIAQRIFDVLEIDYKITRKTLHIGVRAYEKTCDLIPSEPCPMVFNAVNVRMDISHNEDALRQVLQQNTPEVTVSRPLSEDIIFSGRIGIINYIAPFFNEDFVKKCRSKGIQINLLCVSAENLSAERLKFFDYTVYHHDLNGIIQENQAKLKEFGAANLKTKSNKRIIIGEKVFQNYFDATGSMPLFLLDFDKQIIYSE